MRGKRHSWNLGSHPKGPILTRHETNGTNTSKVREEKSWKSIESGGKAETSSEEVLADLGKMIKSHPMKTEDIAGKPTFEVSLSVNT